MQPVGWIREPGATAVGIAHSGYAEALVREEPGLIDYVELPFEQLVHAPRAIEIRTHVPVVLHCASLSLAGDAPPDPLLVDHLASWIEMTGTPWLGEHLAYVRADGVWREVAEHIALAGPDRAWAHAGAPARARNEEFTRQPFNVGYTVSPQFSAPVLGRVLAAVDDWQRRLGLPVLLENGPIYFQMPGSTMSQLTFIREICSRSSTALLLLDIAHLVVTAANLAADPSEMLNALPLDRVIEVHLSGMKPQSGIAWDDHTEPAPPLVFELLAQVLRRARPRAVTLEYNWDAGFPRDLLQRDVERVREIVLAAHDGAVPA
jgi:uncharacterized protein